MQTHSLTHSHKHAHTHSLTHSHKHAHIHSLTHSHKHAHTHSLTHSHCLSHTHSLRASNFECGPNPVGPDTEDYDARINRRLFGTPFVPSKPCPGC